MTGEHGSKPVRSPKAPHALLSNLRDRKSSCCFKILFPLNRLQPTGKVGFEPTNSLFHGDCYQFVCNNSRLRSQWEHQDSNLNPVSYSHGHLPFMLYSLNGQDRIRTCKSPKGTAFTARRATSCPTYPK